MVASLVTSKHYYGKHHAGKHMQASIISRGPNVRRSGLLGNLLPALSAAPRLETGLPKRNARYPVPLLLRQDRRLIGWSRQADRFTTDGKPPMLDADDRPGPTFAPG
jgi:hypothetical protein